MQQRKLGPFQASVVSLGCMTLSHPVYGSVPTPDEAAQILNRALDIGTTMLDTAAQYGFGANETLIGNAVKHRRKEYVLASKAGMFKNAQGVREINGHPDVLKQTCEDALKRLQTDAIDLYYLHRWDKRYPLEDQVGALADLVKAGKVKTIGLSEVSADTIRKAHKVHPIAAVQTEYSLWTRNAELGSLAACKELGIAFVAFSPVARGYLSGKLKDVTTLDAKDLRRGMPRFQGENWAHNLALLPAMEAIAREQGCTMAQLAIAWVIARSEHIIVIPGTTRLDHLEENAKAAEVRLLPETVAKLDAMINEKTVSGARYPAPTMAEIDTENA